MSDSEPGTTLRRPRQANARPAGRTGGWPPERRKVDVPGSRRRRLRDQAAQSRQEFHEPYSNLPQP
jgi:hypothetical protein